MDTWTAITTQRAVRNFDGRPVPGEHVEQILEAGRRAPSSKNDQDWAFIVCREPDLLRQMAGVGPYADHLAGAAFAVALLTPEEPDPDAYGSDLYDLGQATQSMMLTAVSLGIGSVHAAVYDHALARRLLGYPETHRCDYVISFGYPARPGLLDKPRRNVRRKPVADVVHWEHW